ncbi:unnamed protein product [Dibothriocephalus latus]|uniref:Uncharacterized protein n=1 Tax=Dibothriocephalus latus TaxID=60516 RepID=A0A3P6QGP3_DIBLA|nr:unnamed protein product [Dibothriocephalus latus]
MVLDFPITLPPPFSFCQDGALTPPRDGSLPTLTEVNFNGLANRSELMKPDPSSGFRVYVLGSRLNKGGLNTLTVETPFSASQHAAAQPKAIRRNLYTWRAPPKPTAPKDEVNLVFFSCIFAFFLSYHAQTEEERPKMQVDLYSPFRTVSAFIHTA